MPQSVREDVSMEECADLLGNIPFFTHVDNAFLREVSLTTSIYLFAPGDMILYSGDMGREMYCIRKGYTEVSTKCSTKICSLALTRIYDYGQNLKDNVEQMA
jgi:signal-transduction protein with cAMP-binding, CBS, and nucleotidyltransferase domain